jgi:hypothetical protein
MAAVPTFPTLAALAALFVLVSTQRIDTEADVCHGTTLMSRGGLGKKT